MRHLFILAFLVTTSSWSWAAEFAVVQCALPTVNGGTVDCTSSGFGTPKGAMVFGGYGTANGTAVDHAGLWIGGYDGTNQTGMAFASEDGQADSDTAFVRDTNSALITLLETDQSQNGDCTASFITDGMRLTCADAPPAAYHVNVLLLGGSGVSNVYVGSATGHATQDSTQSITSPGFEPDVLIAVAQVGATATSGNNYRASVGFATNETSIVQRALGFSDAHAAASMNTSSTLSTSRVVANGVNGVTLATLEVTDFHATGFNVATRDAATGPSFIYMAVKLNGLSAKLMTSAAPTGTGSQAITGAGFRPQVGLMLQGEFAAVDTVYSTDTGEVFGLSAFTSSAAGTSSTAHEDGDGTSNTESMTDNKVCRTRKDAADYATCTLTSFDADGATFNYTATNGTARQRAILLIQESTSSSSSSRRLAAPMVLQ